jgi:TatD DNase family protein
MYSITLESYTTLNINQYLNYNFAFRNFKMIDFIDIHTHRTKKGENTFSILNISLPNNEIPEKRYLSIGWHPWFIEPFDLQQIRNRLEEVVFNQNVLAIGECGLDRSIKTPFERQTEVFRLHLSTAKSVDKPLIIHCVRAYSDLFEILKKEKFTGKFILHNFNGNQKQIDSFLKFDTYFSLSKQQMIRNLNLNKSLAQIPHERIFLETDDSVFSIQETYSLASELLNIPLIDLKSAIKCNFILIFGSGFVE